MKSKSQKKVFTIKTINKDEIDNITTWQYKIPKQEPSIKQSKELSQQLDNLIHYSNVFMNPGKAKHDIQFIKKTEFDIFYSCKYKYPVLVKEKITKLTGATDPDEPPIDRRVIDDPFREDVAIPAKFRHTLEDYKKYMEYGGSMGHNAPAGQHKTNMDIYSETFLLSNITPQNMVLNSGLWVVIENWCKMLGKHPKINELIVFTGSIPAIKNSRLDNIEINIPGEMFKIVVMKMNSNPNNIFMEILITDNKPYYIYQDTNTPLKIQSKIPSKQNTTRDITQDTKLDNIVKLNNYVLNRNKWIQFQNESGINIIKLLNFYNLIDINNYHSIKSVKEIKSFSHFINMDFKLSNSLKILMKKSLWFGKLIYSTTLEQLDYNWSIIETMKDDFENLKYHREYYDYSKKRILDKHNNNPVFMNDLNFNKQNKHNILNWKNKYYSNKKYKHAPRYLYKTLKYPIK